MQIYYHKLNGFGKLFRVGKDNCVTDEHTVVINPRECMCDNPPDSICVNARQLAYKKYS